MSVTEPDTLLHRLQAHIAPHGLELEQVLAQVDDVFGEPLLVVATGSVLAGYGNERSDLDLYVIVPDDVASLLPLMSYPRGARIEVVLHGADTVTRRYGQLTEQWPPTEASLETYARRRKSVDSMSRFGTGLALLTDGGHWQSWQREVDAEVGGWLAGWWAAEAVRKQVAARELAPAKPRLAALKAGEALIAALERRAVLAGERYFRWKWLGEKFDRLGDAQGRAWFDLAVRPPLDLADTAAYLREVNQLVDELLLDLDRTGWRVQLRPAPGVSWHPFGRETLVSRWTLRTVSVDPGSVAATDRSWGYGLDEPWEPDVTGLFNQDMLWLGISGPADGGAA